MFSAITSWMPADISAYGDCSRLDPLPRRLPLTHAHKSATLHVAALDRRLAAALQAGVGKLAQRLVEEEADVRRRDLVGRDIVAQFGIALGMLRVPRQVFAGQLALDEFRIFGEKKNAPLRRTWSGRLVTVRCQ